MSADNILDLALENTPELTLVPVGDAQVEIMSTEVKRSKDGATTYIQLVLKSRSHEDTENIFHSLFIPGANDDKDKANGKKRRIKDFLSGFGIPYEGSLDVTTWKGGIGNVIVKHTSDPAYGDKAEIAKIYPRS